MNTTTFNTDFMANPTPLSPSEETKREIIVDIVKSITEARFRDGVAVGFSFGIIVGVGCMILDRKLNF